MRHPPGSRQPGWRLPAAAKAERDTAYRNRGSVADGFLDVEGDTSVNLKKWPIDSETFVRRKHDIKVWRDQKTKKFARKPSPQQMSKWTQEKGYHHS